MIFPKAKKIAKELDWYKTKDGVFGLYKDYFFNVGDGSLLSNPQYKYVSATTDTLTEEQKLQIKTELETNKKLLKFSNFEIGDNSVFVQFFENLTFTKLKTVYTLFDFLVDLFKKVGISEQNKCHNCDSKDSVKYYELNDNGVLLCSPCFRQIENSYYEVERERISEEKNYLTGFLGSLVFSIPGIIVWVLIAVYLERLASAMAMVIAFLGLKGYDYFKGRHGKMTKYIIVFSNIISILIANATTVIALLVNEGLTINQSIQEFQTNQAVKDIFNQNTMISFILAFFIWIWLLFLLKDKKMTVKLADKF
ncbi:hypothetical protein SDC9_42833 [bioreactor metagenome]|jgi:hypothetical protein|uniref:Uncharacterized protein n=1 Tax=bioreactor metagenome TaxID=1076179 RepID=A0A644VYZ2_9ZZZZ|nr:hypothetical protein [Paludibacter sp.]